MAVKGQDVVYKDVIEPLESVSVSLTPTDKADINEFGTPVEVRTYEPQANVEYVGVFPFSKPEMPLDWHLQGSQCLPC